MSRFEASMQIILEAVRQERFTFTTRQNVTLKMSLQLVNIIGTSNIPRHKQSENSHNIKFH